MSKITDFLRRLLPATSRARLADETDNTFLIGGRTWGTTDRDRFDYNREEMLRLSLEAWRVNPLARRIVGLTTQYVVGAGLRLRADHDRTQAFLMEWWDHRLNLLTMRVYEWCDELTRSGELFLLLSTDASGMSYVRAVPAAEIMNITTAANDTQQETAYIQHAPEVGGDPLVWPAYDEQTDLQHGNGDFGPVMLHYAINRPVGALHGESDLAPLLKWLSRYAAWLEDRARLNRYRNAFLFVVKGRWASEAERLARQTSLAAAPPPPGSFLVVDESESWEVINPQLESQEAGEDGLALKKMVAAGAGLPLHFLAEPEGSNRSTAESAGGPTYRHFEQRQEFFKWLVADMARVVLRRRAMVDGRIKADVQLQVTGADLSARDNAALGIAMSTVISALVNLRDRCVIDDAELLRMAYRFAGEVVEVDTLLERGKKAGPRMWADEGERKKAAGVAGITTPGKPAGVKIDPESGSTKGLPEIE